MVTSLIAISTSVRAAVVMFGNIARELKRSLCLQVQSSKTLSPILSFVLSREIVVLRFLVVLPEQLLALERSLSRRRTVLRSHCLQTHSGGWKP